MREVREKQSVTMQTSAMENKKFKMTARTIAFIGIMGAASSIMMLFRFPIPFLPPFLSFDLSGVFEMLGGFMFGPIAALFIVLVKILLQLVMQGSLSFGTGELQGLMLSSAYLLPATILYMKRKTKKTAAVGMTISTVFASVVAVFTNMYMIIPLYAGLCGMKMSDFVDMCATANPIIKNVTGMILLGILPFNLIKYGVTSIVTMFVYKKISGFVKGIIER